MSHAGADSCYQIHVIRADATNSAAAQQSKVHVCQAFTVYNCGIEDEANDLSLISIDERARSCVADLQFVPSGCTALNLLATYDKQLKSIGIPAFEDCTTPKGSVRVFIMVTDDGPDQRGCEKLISQKLDSSSLFFRFKCLLHQLHIIVSKQLKRLHTHYPDVSKVVNVWRTVGMPSKIHQEYAKRYGQERANATTRKLPPRALKGRWGSISAAESYILACGFTELPDVFASAVGLPDEKDVELDLVKLAENVFDMDSNTYSRVLGRWRRESILALRSTSFWLVLTVAHISKKPLQHLMNWLMSNNTSVPLADDCDLVDLRGASPSTGKLPLLVWGQLTVLMGEFEQVLNAQWCEWELFHELLAKEAEESQSGWIACLVATTLEIASEMNRRVVQYLCDDFPGKLAWLVYEKPDYECEVRKALAAELLASRESDFDACFTGKLLSLWREDLQSCSITGSLNPKLYKLLLDACHVGGIGKDRTNNWFLIKGVL